jgi:hypothetical protein
MNAKYTLIASILAGLASSAMAGNSITYTDWTSASAPGVSATAGGTMALSSGTVDVTYDGEFTFAQINDGGTQFWTEPNPSLLPYTGNSVVGNAPSSPDIIALEEQSQTEVNTITFSTPVLDPIMLINSLGTPSSEVSYVFTQTPTLLSAGQGYWGGNATSLSLSGDTLSGAEGAGALEFQGEISSITWTISGAEFWNGFTIGAVTQQTQGVPDGGTTLALVGMGFGALAAFRRRK